MNFKTCLRSVAVMLIAVCAGCNSEVATTSPKADQARVAVVKPQRKTLRYTVEEPGQIEGFEEAPLYAKLAAYVDKVNVDIGSAVKQGDVLAVLRIPELEREYEQKVAAVNQAKAAADQAQAAVGVAHAAITSTKAKLTQVMATKERTDADFQRWQSEYARVAELAEKGSITRKAADEAKDQMQAADAARKETDSAIDSAKAVVTESEAKEVAAIADKAARRPKWPLSKLMKLTSKPCSITRKSVLRLLGSSLDATSIRATSSSRRRPAPESRCSRLRGPICCGPSPTSRKPTLHLLRSARMPTSACRRWLTKFSGARSSGRRSHWTQPRERCGSRRT